MGLFNPYLLVLIVVAWAASIYKTATYFEEVGINETKAIAADIEKARQETREDARQGAASEIAKIKVTNTTVRSKAETIVRENVRYTECKHDPDGLRLLNEAISGATTGTVGGTGSSKLPGIVPPN